MKRINISQVDTIFANGNYPIEFLIYYKNRLKSKNIRKALKKISSTFWPVFGEYADGVISSRKYKTDNHFEEIILEQEFNPKAPAEEIYNEYCNTIPNDINTLFFLKIIQLKSGTIIIPKMNHIAGDGYSYFYFLSVLAKIAQPNFIPFKKSIIRQAAKPHHDRIILKDFKFGLKEFKPWTEPDELTIKFEEIPRSDLKNMIKDVSSNLEQSVSENDILSAMVVKRLIHVYKGKVPESFKLTFPIDVRRKIKDFGPKFIGNALLFGEVDFDKTEQKQNIDEMAAKIRRFMPQIVKERYIKFIEKLEVIISNNQTKKLNPFDPEKGCLVTNLSKLPSGKLDFGSGPANFIAPLTIEKNSAAFLADKNNYILRLAY